MEAIQRSADLIGWHTPVHAILSEGLFVRDGFIIRITQSCGHERWRGGGCRSVHEEAAHELGGVDQEGVRGGSTALSGMRRGDEVIRFIEKCQADVVEKIWPHRGLWEKVATRPAAARTQSRRG